MGLTFGYEFRLAERYSSDDVNVVLQQLKQRAERLRFARISQTYDGVVDFLPDDWRRLFNVLADVNARQVSGEERSYSGDVNTARGFLAMPGKGADAASFGFMRRQFDDDGSREWFWQGWCKTQYASVHGEQHFLDCHLRMVDMMEYAIQSGIDVTVWDEGQYWETRDRNVLLAELEKMNRLIAGIAGRVHDSSLSIEAPIFEHPDFERLEGG
jgi:hypothetical protein